MASGCGNEPCLPATVATIVPLNSHAACLPAQLLLAARLLPLTIAFGVDLLVPPCQFTTTAPMASPRTVTRGPYHGCQFLEAPREVRQKIVRLLARITSPGGLAGGRIPEASHD